MSRRWMQRAAVGLLLLAVAAPGCSSSKSGRQNPIYYQDIATGDTIGANDGQIGPDGTVPTADGVILSDVPVGKPGQIQAIQKNDAFVNCDEAAAQDNFGFSTAAAQVDLTGVVVVSPKFELYTHKTDPAKSLDGYFIMEANGGPWSGILLAVSRTSDTAIEMGDVVDVSGEAVDYYCNTQIKATAVKVTGKVGTLPPATEVSAAELSDPTTAEQWEAVLVKVTNGEVTAGANNYGEWKVDGALVVDDLYPYQYEAAVGNTVSVQGLMYYNFSVFKLEPRFDADIVVGGGNIDQDTVVTDGGGGSGTTIHDIQSSTSSTTCSTPEGQATIDPAVKLEGVIVTSPRFQVTKDKLDGYFIADAEGGEYSGMQLVVPVELGISLDKGDVVDVTGKWVEYYCMSQLSAEKVEKVGTGTPPTAEVVTAADVATGGDKAEMYEGVYVQIDNAVVTNPDLGYGQWEVDSALMVDDVFDYAYVPTMDDTIAHLRGVITFSYNDSKLLPTSGYDIDLSGTGPGPDVVVTDSGPVGDTGSPGDSSIKAIQSAPESTTCSTPDGFANVADGVKLEGVIVASPSYPVDKNGKLTGYFVSDTDGGKYSGLQLVIPVELGVTLSQGDVIDVTGDWVEYYCMTQVTATEVQVISQGAVPPTAAKVSPADVATGGAQAEAYEGVYVQVDNVTVTNPDMGYGEWQVDGALRVDDFFSFDYVPTMNDQLDELRGIMTYSFAERKLLPTSNYDIILGSGGGGDDTGGGNTDTGVTPPGTSISDLQTSDISLACKSGSVDGGKVSVEGVTVVSPKGYAGSGLAGYHIMVPPNGPNAGIFLVLQSSLNTPELKEGDVIDVSGSHKEYYCVSELFADSFQVVTSGASTSLTPVSTTTAALAAGKEELEGTLVRVDNVTAADVNDQYGDFPIGNGVLVDDTYFKHVATQGEAFVSVTGFLHYGFEAWRILPRSAADLKQ